MMANLFILKFPSFSSSLRTVSASASSNGSFLYLLSDCFSLPYALETVDELGLLTMKC